MDNTAKGVVTFSNWFFGSIALFCTVAVKAALDADQIVPAIVLTIIAIVAVAVMIAVDKYAVWLYSDTNPN